MIPPAYSNGPVRALLESQRRRKVQHEPHQVTQEVLKVSGRERLFSDQLCPPRSDKETFCFMCFPLKTFAATCCSISECVILAQTFSLAALLPFLSIRDYQLWFLADIHPPLPSSFFPLLFSSLSRLHLSDDLPFLSSRAHTARHCGKKQKESGLLVGEGRETGGRGALRKHSHLLFSQSPLYSLEDERIERRAGERKRGRPALPS